MPRTRDATTRTRYPVPESQHEKDRFPIQDFAIR